MSAARLRTASDAPIPADGEARGIDWTRIYRIFMRALAVMTIARGLSQWLVICGGPNADGLGFEELPPASRPRPSSSPSSNSWPASASG